MKSLVELKKLLVFHGMWSQESPGQYKWLRRLRYLYPRLVLATTLYRVLVVHIVDALLNLTNPLALCESTILTFFTLMTFIKGGTLMFQMERFLKLIHSLEKLHKREQLSDSTQRRVLHKTERYSNLFVKYFPAFGTFMATMATFVQMLEVFPNRTLQDRGWFPYDIKPSPVYELTLFCYSCTMVWIVNIVAVCDATLMSVFIHTIGQFKILKFNLRNLRQCAKRTMKEEGKHCCSNSPNKNMRNKWTPEQLDKPLSMSERCLHVRMSLNLKPRPKKTSLVPEQKTKLKQCDNMWLSKDNLFTKQNSLQSGDVDMRSKYHKHREKFKFFKQAQCVCSSLVWNKENVVDLEMQRLLNKCINHHNELIKFSNDLMYVFNPAFIIQLFCNLIPTGVYVLYFGLSEKFDSKNQAFFQLLGACLMQLLLFCWASNKITEESAEVKDAIFDNDWFDASPTFLKSMRIVISRANCPVIIKAATFIPMSLEIFLKVSQTAYSYYVAMNVYLTKNARNKHHTDIALFASASYELRSFDIK